MLSAAPRASLTLPSCSPNYPRASRIGWTLARYCPFLNKTKIVILLFVGLVCAINRLRPENFPQKNNLRVLSRSKNANWNKSSCYDQTSRRKRPLWDQIFHTILRNDWTFHPKNSGQMQPDDPLAISLVETKGFFSLDKTKSEGWIALLKQKERTWLSFPFSAIVDRAVLIYNSREKSTYVF